MFSVGTTEKCSGHGDKRENLKSEGLKRVCEVFRLCDYVGGLKVDLKHSAECKRERERGKSPRSNKSSEYIINFGLADPIIQSEY